MYQHELCPFVCIYFCKMWLLLQALCHRTDILASIVTAWLLKNIKTVGPEVWIGMRLSRGDDDKLPCASVWSSPAAYYKHTASSDRKPFPLISSVFSLLSVIAPCLCFRPPMPPLTCTASMVCRPPETKVQLSMVTRSVPRQRLSLFLSC